MGVGAATILTGAETGFVAVVIIEDIPTFFTGFAGAELLEGLFGEAFAFHCAVHVKFAEPIVIGADAP